MGGSFEAPVPGSPGETVLTIRDADGAWTSDYQAIRVTLDLPSSG